jgi:hypothetical protein
LLFSDRESGFVYTSQMDSYELLENIDSLDFLDYSNFIDPSPPTDFLWSNPRFHFYLIYFSTFSIHFSIFILIPKNHVFSFCNMVIPQTLILFW